MSNLVQLRGMARRRAGAGIWLAASLAGPAAMLLWAGTLYAQTTLHGHVTDARGRAVQGVQVAIEGAEDTATSDADGVFTLALKATAGSIVLLRAEDELRGFAPAEVAVRDVGADIQVTMRPSMVSQQATVTATRSSAETGPAALVQSSLSGRQLREYPALTLDESLRQHAGFELFRRSSGWVQNPTSQGISLRGLGSTAVSRTLVLANNAPLNDPFGGWVHWDELPPEIIEAVTVTSGGGSDLYGSSAVGGVIDVLPGHPGDARVDVSASAAGEDTRTADWRGDLRQGRWSELVAAQDFRTAGYILTAPESPGVVDVPANVHFENGRVEIDRAHGDAGRLFVTGNVLNESRNNGTPATVNSTRLWRYVVGDDWTAGARVTGRARLFGSDEAYSQTFSSVNAARSSETLTRLQKVRTQEVGVSADASYHRLRVALIGGGDVRDIRAEDREKPSGALQVVSSRQRFVGGFGEVLGDRGRWSGGASLRVDSVWNLDTEMFAGAMRTSTPDRSEVVASPRAGVVFQAAHSVTVHGSGYRAFRTPTMNELYRSFQVGSSTTLADANLVSERATGVDGGVTVQMPRIAAQGSYFWIEINRPVASPQIASTASTLTLRRMNLGQVQSQGLDTSLAVNEGHAVSGAVGYQYAHSVVTKFAVDPLLVGKWLPEVPRHSFTAQMRFQKARVGEFVISARRSGQVFDDNANTLVLHSFFELDGYGARALGRGVTAFVSLQNLTARRAEVARTPLLALGSPLVAQGGVRYSWGGRP